MIFWIFSDQVEEYFLWLAEFISPYKARSKNKLNLTRSFKNTKKFCCFDNKVGIFFAYFKKILFPFFLYTGIELGRELFGKSNNTVSNFGEYWIFHYQIFVYSRGILRDNNEPQWTKKVKISIVRGAAFGSVFEYALVAV